MSSISAKTVKVCIVKTTLPGVWSVILKSKTPKVGKTKDSIIAADKSGSMISTMTGGLVFMNTAPSVYGGPMSVGVGGPMSSYSQPYGDEEEDVATPSVTSFATPLPIGPTSFATPTPSTPSKGKTNSPVNDEETRIGCVNGFLQRNIDFFSYMHDSMGLTNHLTVILFDNDCEVFSTHDGMSFSDMKKKVYESLHHNGGTDFSKPLKLMEEYAAKSVNEVDSIFISDGEHADFGMSKDDIRREFFKKVNLTVGIGSCDENTLNDIGKEFLKTESARRLRDTICFRTTETVTNVATHLRFESTEPRDIGYSNMKRESETLYSWPDMSLLLELYAVAETGSSLSLSYRTPDGAEQVTRIILDEAFLSSYQGDDIEVIHDTSLGDKIAFTMEALHQFHKTMKKLKVTTNLDEKKKIIISFKKEVETHPQAFTHADTKVGIYLKQLIDQVNRMCLSKEDKALMDLARNFDDDILKSTSALGSAALAGPATCAVPRDGGVSSMCPICETNHRSVVYDPCGHFVCETCAGIIAKKAKDCPFCRMAVTGCIFVNLTDEQKADDHKLMCPTCNHREVRMVSYDCKHAFSCERCAAKQNVNKGKITCFCGKECKKYVTIYG